MISCCEMCWKRFGMEMSSCSISRTDCVFMKITRIDLGWSLLTVSKRNWSGKGWPAPFRTSILSMCGLQKHVYLQLTKRYSPSLLYPLITNVLGFTITAWFSGVVFSTIRPSRLQVHSISPRREVLFEANWNFAITSLQKLKLITHLIVHRNSR